MLQGFLLSLPLSRQERSIHSPSCVPGKAETLVWTHKQFREQEFIFFFEFRQIAVFRVVFTSQYMYGPEDAGGQRLSQENQLFSSCVLFVDQSLGLALLCTSISDLNRLVKIKGEETADVKLRGEYCLFRSMQI